MFDLRQYQQQQQQQVIVLYQNLLEKLNNLGHAIIVIVRFKYKTIKTLTKR